jgi:hypothetical protein
MQVGWEGNQGVSVQMDYIDQQFDGRAQEIRGIMCHYSSKGELKLFGKVSTVVNSKNQILLSHPLTQKILV